MGPNVRQTECGTWPCCFTYLYISLTWFTPQMPCNSQAWARWKPGTLNSTQVSPCGFLGPKRWSHPCLPLQQEAGSEAGELGLDAFHHRLRASQMAALLGRNGCPIPPSVTWERSMFSKPHFRFWCAGVKWLPAGTVLTLIRYFGCQQQKQKVRQKWRLL